MYSNLEQGKSLFSEYEAIQAPCFSLEDRDWIASLDSNGWVCVEIPDLSKDDVSRSRADVFDWLKGCCSEFDEKDPSSWGADTLPVAKEQDIYMLKSWVGQEEFFWRLREKCRPVFESLWKTKDLLTSFDGGSISKPKPFVPWFHTDQLVDSSPCIQRMVNLFDSGEFDGGLVFLERSHLLFSDYMKDHLDQNKRWSLADTDWTPFQALRKVKPCVKAGTLLLWDSRLFHCGSPPVPSLFENPRLCLYICMMPRKGCDPKTLEQRRSAFEKEQMTGHLCYGPGFQVEDPCVTKNLPSELPDPKLNPLRKLLIGFDPE